MTPSLDVTAQLQPLVRKLTSILKALPKASVSGAGDLVLEARGSSLLLHVNRASMMWGTRAVPGAVAHTGGVRVHGRRFLTLLQGLKGEQVRLLADEGATLHAENLQGRSFTMPGTPEPTHRPASPLRGLKPDLTLYAHELRVALGRIAHARSKRSTSPDWMRGINLRSTDKGLWALATDGTRRSEALIGDPEAVRGELPEGGISLFSEATDALMDLAEEASEGSLDLYAENDRARVVITAAPSSRMGFVLARDPRSEDGLPNAGEWEETPLTAELRMPEALHAVEYLLTGPTSDLVTPMIGLRCTAQAAAVAYHDDATQSRLVGELRGYCRHPFECRVNGAHLLAALRGLQAPAARLWVCTRPGMLPALRIASYRNNYAAYLPVDGYTTL